MTFDELVTETTLWAKAPHMANGPIQSAIRAVTLKYHRKEKFWRDLASLTFTPTDGNAVQVLDIPSNFPQFRQIGSIVQSVTPGYRTPPDIDIVHFADLVDEDGWTKVNIAVLAGTNLNIKFQVCPTSYQVNYYLDPIVSPQANYASWIAETQPDLIIAGAAARVLSWNAESEIYQAAVKEEASQWMELLQNNIEGIGR